jgi:putative ABC transport system permease protein
MIFSEIIRMALSSLGVNKLRSALTMLGITIGVFSVIGVMTTVSALRGSVETGLSALGSDVFQFTKWPQGFQGGGNNPNWRRYAMRRDVTLDQARRYQELMAPYTEAVSLRVNTGGVQAMYENRKTTASVNLVGTNEHYLASNKFNLEAGRNLLAEDIELGRPVVVIGQDLVQRLFPNESPLGQRIKMRARTYTVVGVLESKGTAFGQTQDAIALIPITRFLSDYGSRGRSIVIATQTPSQDRYNDTVDRAIGTMRVVRGLQAETENDFELSSNDSLVAAFATVADTLQMGSLAISAIALLAAGVGIMNIMLVSVTERTKEIGVRKSIGARKKTILAQFLVESVVISLAGGLLGILLGVVVGNGLALVMNATVVIPWNWAAAGLGVCSAIGVGFGFYPAWKAASLDPLEALRSE